MRGGVCATHGLSSSMGLPDLQFGGAHSLRSSNPARRPAALNAPPLLPYPTPWVPHSFRLGRQEDAHEYLRCLLDNMHEACLKPYQPKPNAELARTTFVYRIFGGRLRSEVHGGQGNCGAGGSSGGAGAEAVAEAGQCLWGYGQ